MIDLDAMEQRLATYPGERAYPEEAAELGDDIEFGTELRDAQAELIAEVRRLQSLADAFHAWAHSSAFDTGHYARGTEAADLLDKLVEYRKHRA